VFILPDFNQNREVSHFNKTPPGKSVGWDPCCSMRDTPLHCERAQNSDKEETLLQPPFPQN